MYVYCGKQHWINECNKYPDLQRRKSKARGFCFICLRKGHLLRECSLTRACVSYIARKKEINTKVYVQVNFLRNKRNCRMHHLKRKKPISLLLKNISLCKLPWVRRKIILSIYLVYNLMKTKSLDVVRNSQTL